MPLLYLAQSVEGMVGREALREIGELLGITTAEVEAVATFYSMYRLRPTGEHVVNVCTNLACKLRGAAEVFEAAHEAAGIAHGEELSADGLFTVHEEECLGVCDFAPAVQINFCNHDAVSPERMRELIATLRGGDVPSPARGPGVRQLQGRLPRARGPRGGAGVVTIDFEPRLTRNWDDPSAVGLDGYVAAGGYAGLRQALGMADADIVELVKASGLRGRGGAGFPTGMKWGFVPRDTGKPTYVVVNFDESEPGTCNNRELVEREPHRLLEGTAIAALAIGCETALHLRARRVPVAVDRARARDRRGLCRRVPRRRHLWLGQAGRRRVAPGRRRLHLRRGDRAAELAGGSARSASPAPAVPGGGRACSPARPSSTTSRR